ncbi:hypothetical protein MKQ68_08880 [Chitinophaga horti]|uniref:Uncharacterized protein n=1 Tax=Chitinophaga horti TaxID=2920382 RepID=A0ABY6J697_9BACT|nr:hypothetical protein [Chitinophaga horti]UYQ95208.1 hypothetical protein MKQ68_08880 [Chitinophaga horti]
MPPKVILVALALSLCACRNNNLQVPPTSSYLLFPGGQVKSKLAYKHGRANTINIGPLIVQTKN